MRCLALTLLLAGTRLLACTAAHPPAPLASPATAPPPAPVALDADAVVKKSRALLDALDRADVAAFRAAAGAGFAWFEEGRFYSADDLAHGLSSRRDRHAPIRTRSFEQERVFLAPGAATYVGLSVQHLPAEGARAAHEWEGWTTLVWVRDGAGSKLAHAEWQRGGREAERREWNERFRLGDGFSTAPNQLLIAAIKDRKPGAALDLGMGQGRNALYLASQGWQVTGVDISDEAIRRAKAQADKDGLRLQAIEADLDSWDLPADSWDLITMIYSGDDAKLIDKAKRGLRPGGLFVLEFFHRDSDAVQGGGMHGFASGELRARFSPGFRVVRDEVVEDVADWGLRKQKLVRFVAEKM